MGVDEAEGGVVEGHSYPHPAFGTLKHGKGQCRNEILHPCLTLIYLGGKIIPIVQLHVWFSKKIVIIIISFKEFFLEKYC